MKKLSLLLLSVALFSFISLNSCKQAPKPEEAIEEAVEEAVEDIEAAADTVVEAIEEAAE